MNKPKIIYGSLKIKSILRKEKSLGKEFDYLDTDLEENIDPMVIFDGTKFLELINIFNIANIPGLFFIKFDKIFMFEFQIEISKFNGFIKTNSELDKKPKFEFKYPRKINDKNIIKSYSTDFFKSYIIDYLNFLKKNNDDNIVLGKKEITIDLIESNKSNGQPNNFTNLNDRYIDFKSTPILFNGCEVVKTSFNNLTIKKKVLVGHIQKCKDCEIINNNEKKINLDKKIVIKRILNKDNFKIFDDIVYAYQNINKIVLKETNGDFLFEKEKINIVMCSESTNTYSRCVFMLCE
jgi:hypothetical protein